jgi:hypothetical protein
MSGPPIVDNEIQISHNDTVFTIQVTLVEDSSTSTIHTPVDTLKIVRYP